MFSALRPRLFIIRTLPYALYTMPNTPRMQTPPRWASWLLKTFGHPDTLEEVEGDLLELYDYWVQTHGKAAAGRRYALSALKLMRPMAQSRHNEPYSPPFSLSLVMISNYIKIARRQLWRNRLFTGLNMVGLSIGVSACWIIYQLVSFEFGFDTRIPNRDRVVRAVSRFMFDGKEQGNPGIPMPMPDAVRQQIGGIERVVPVRLTWVETIQVPQPGGKPQSFPTEGDQVIAVDSNYFRMVPYTWLAGKPDVSLNQPNQIVLTQSQATAFFPKTDLRQVVGKTITLWDTLAVQVTGVVQDLPFLSDFTGKEFLSLATVRRKYEPAEWSNTNSDSQMYAVLSPGADINQVEANINALSNKNSEEFFKKWGGAKRWHKLQPLADLHFGTDYREGGHRADKSVLYGLMGLAAFILVLAVINYINLASAQIPQRAREIGIRKTLGSRRRTLILQFLGETAVITGLSFALSYGLSHLFFQQYSDLLPTGTRDYVNWPLLVLFLAGLLIIITLLAGLYPGWLIARFQPVTVLRGQGFAIEGSPKRITLRKSLIVFQFFIAQLFIVGALIINQQLRYFIQADMGFARDAIITAQIPWKTIMDTKLDKRDALRDEVKHIAGVAMVSLGTQPASRGYSSNIHDVKTRKGIVSFNLFRKYVDTDYIPLYQLPLVAGRNLQPSDTIREYVINETAAREMGFARPADAVGAFLKENGGDANRTVPVVGVVKDFHAQSFHEKIKPIALMTNRESLSMMNIKLSGRSDSWPQTINTITRTWHTLYPDAPFEYKFYDQTIGDFYKKEQQISRIINLATGVAILISCLGLFGLATLTAHQRTKEIGIRKVLGASVAGVVALLSKDFVKLVLIAILLASPLAWYAMHRWLESFAYRIDIEWWMFATAGLLAVAIALITISFQSIKAAVVNPIKSLRAE